MERAVALVALSLSPCGRGHTTGAAVKILALPEPFSQRDRAGYVALKKECLDLIRIESRQAFGQQAVRYSSRTTAVARQDGSDAGSEQEKMMPTYYCTTIEGRLADDEKGRIASEITRIHCEVTGAPKFFAQVIFEQVKPGNYYMGGKQLKHDQIFVYGHIRTGRAAVDKSRMIRLMAEAIAAAARFDDLRSVWVYVAELPPRQMIEFGRLLPEAGDEPAWTAALSEADRQFMESVGR
jgi:phenylpyruvate tautomerase PptA (4-oxalocrotonate tautomerase family)